MSSEENEIAGPTKYILVICGSAQIKTVDLESYLGNMFHDVQLSYAKDVAEDCQIFAIQDDTEDWDHDRLIQAATGKWSELANLPEMHYVSYLAPRASLGETLFLLVRESTTRSDAPHYKYANSVFPWTVQTSFTIWPNDEGRKYSDSQRNELQTIMDESDLTFVSGFGSQVFVDSQIRKGALSFAPCHIQFYKPEDLHGFWSKIKQWITDNNGRLVTGKPVECPSCAHFSADDYDPCWSCGTKLGDW